MKSTRRIQKIVKSKPTLEGAGVHLKRVFGFGDTELFDPFLLLDDFHGYKESDYIKGFPWHPHRGIETITYMMKGTVEHGDSLGNKGIISPGDVQWMTAGSGIIHQEMPKGSEKGEMWGFQLWANLPADKKMIDPRYQEITSRTIPVIENEDGSIIRIISGTIEGVKGPVDNIIIDPLYCDISLSPNMNFTLPVQDEHTVMAYITEGEGYFDPEKGDAHIERSGRNYFDYEQGCLIKKETLVLYNNGDHIIIATEKESVRFLLISGKPLKEPVAWYGPIVMNTREELELAFKEYKEGTFITHK